MITCKIEVIFFNFSILCIWCCVKCNFVMLFLFTLYMLFVIWNYWFVYKHSYMGGKFMCSPTILFESVKRFGFFGLGIGEPKAELDSPCLEEFACDMLLALYEIKFLMISKPRFTPLIYA